MAPLKVVLADPRRLFAGIVGLASKRRADGPTEWHWRPRSLSPQAFGRPLDPWTLRHALQRSGQDLTVISRSEQMRRVLLTGAEGLIGGILRERLADRYHFRYLTRSRQRYSDVVGDVADMARVRKVVQGVDSIVHLAGAASVNSSWETVLASNIVGTRNNEGRFWDLEPGA